QKLNLAYNSMHELPDFIGHLTHLKYIDVSGNPRIKLPKSLAQLKGLTVDIGNNSLTLKDQAELHHLFPNVTFNFSNEFDDGDPSITTGDENAEREEYLWKPVKTETIKDK